eukprot:4537956-Pleurochrysis_carterae.AAC.1
MIAACPRAVLDLSRARQTVAEQKRERRTAGACFSCAHAPRTIPATMPDATKQKLSHSVWSVPSPRPGRPHELPTMMSSTAGTCKVRM